MYNQTAAPIAIGVPMAPSIKQDRKNNACLNTPFGISSSDAPIKKNPQNNMYNHIISNILYQIFKCVFQGILKSEFVSVKVAFVTV